MIKRRYDKGITFWKFQDAVKIEYDKTENVNDITISMFQDAVKIEYDKTGQLGLSDSWMFQDAVKIEYDKRILHERVNLSP